MDKKTKKIIIIVFTALISLAASVTGCLLGVSPDTLLPTDFSVGIEDLLVDTQETVSNANTASGNQVNIEYLRSIASSNN